MTTPPLLSIRTPYCTWYPPNGRETYCKELFQSTFACRGKLARPLTALHFFYLAPFLLFTSFLLPIPVLLLLPKLYLAHTLSGSAVYARRAMAGTY
ncbi:hypothetical protein Mapa_014141 [Marchantia paleacea]|nr:hypothetical protein Mapa_014141 [Marchantia paleacea]